MDRRTVIGMGSLLLGGGGLVAYSQLDPSENLPRTVEKEETIYTSEESIQDNEEWFAEFPISSGDTFTFDITSDSKVKMEIFNAEEEKIYTDTAESPSVELEFDIDGTGEIRVKGAGATRDVTIAENEETIESGASYGAKYDLEENTDLNYTFTPLLEDANPIRFTVENISEGEYILETEISEESSETVTIEDMGTYQLVVENQTDETTEWEYEFIFEGEPVVYEFSVGIDREYVTEITPSEESE
jgi:hypothetical protein